MGIDMRLQGHETNYTEKRPVRGDSIRSVYYIANWWNEPELNKIVFEAIGSPGNWNGRESYLDPLDLKAIVKKLKESTAPDETGEVEEAIEIFEYAIKWVEDPGASGSRWISYTADW